MIVSVSDIQLGPSVVLIRSLPDGEWVGLGQLQGAVEFDPAPDVRPFVRRGPTPSDVYHLGFGARVRTPVAQGSLEILERVIPGLVRGDDGEGLRYVGGGYVAVARRIQPVQVAIIPVQEIELGLDAPHAVHVWRAVPTIQSPLRWADVSEGIQSLTIEWIALRDASRPAGADIFAIGPLRDVLTVPPEGEEPQDPPPELEPPLYPGDSAPTMTVVDWNDGSVELLISPLQASWPDPVLTGTRVQIVPRDAQDWIGSLIRDQVSRPDELLQIQIRGLPHKPMRARARHEYRSALPSLATEWSNSVQWGRFTVAGYKPTVSLEGYLSGFLFIRAELPIEASVWGEIWQQCIWEIYYYRPGLGESEWASHSLFGASQNLWVATTYSLAYLGPHYYRVRVRQLGPPGDVYSEWSDPLVLSPGLQDMRPSLSAQQIGAGQARLLWEWPTRLPAVEYWEIQRAAFPNFNWVHIGTYTDPGDPGPTREYVDSGLAKGIHGYRVRGWRDGQHTAWSNESWVNITQSAPIDPWISADLDPEDLNDVLLEWGGVPGAREWELQRKFGDGEWEDAGVFPADQTSTRLENLSSGQYSFRVRAFLSNDAWSDWSIPAAVTVPGAQQGLVRIKSGRLANDRFDLPDNSPLGADWAPLGDPLIVRDGTAQPPTAGDYANVAVVRTADDISAVSFSAWPGTGGEPRHLRLLALVQGPGTWYELRYGRWDGAYRLRLARSVGGVYAVLGELVDPFFSPPPVAQHDFWLRARYGEQRVFANISASPRLSAFDTSIVGSGTVGIGIYSSVDPVQYWIHEIDRIRHTWVYAFRHAPIRVTGVPQGASVRVTLRGLSTVTVPEQNGEAIIELPSVFVMPGLDLSLRREGQTLATYNGAIYGGDHFHYTG